MSGQNDNNGNGEKRAMMSSSAKDEEPAKRSKLGSLLLGIVFGFLAILFVLVLGLFLAYRSLRSAVDLGVNYSYADFQNFVEKAGFELEGEDRQFCFTCPVEYSGQIKADFLLSGQEASAWFDSVNSELGPISGTQILFGDDQVSLATNISYQGISYPVFASGKITKSGPQSVNIDLNQAKVGKVSVPVGVIPRVEKNLEGFINHKLGQINGLTIDELVLDQNGLRFQGTVPEKIIAR